MSYQELINNGFNIDTGYRSQIEDLHILENEYEYYKRSKRTMKKLIKLHRKKPCGTILLVAHAPSLEVLTHHLMNKQARPEQLLRLASEVGYCNMTIIDRDPLTKEWQFRSLFDE